MLLAVLLQRLTFEPGPGLDLSTRAVRAWGLGVGERGMAGGRGNGAVACGRCLGAHDQLRGCAHAACTLPA